MKKRHKSNLITLLIFLVFTGVPVFFEYLTTPAPVKRNIHIDHFRYGMEPSIIRVNRGDILNFTFSTLDTGHSFFLQDYGIDVKVSPASEKVSVYDPFNATASPYSTEKVTITAGINGFLKNLVSSSRFRCHVYCGRMHGFEQGDLIVRPNWLFSGSIGFIFALFFNFLFRSFTGITNTKGNPKFTEINKRGGFINRILKWRPLQFIFTVPFIALFFLMILAGLFGTKVGGRNIAVMLTWATWMFVLTVFMVPAGARLWCFLCPIPSIGEYLQRGATIGVRGTKSIGNRYFGFAKLWPSKLKGPWLKTFLFLIIGSFSASLAGQPRWTAGIFVFMISIAVLMSLIWKNRSFCLYVCPVSTFISTYSPAGRVQLKARDTKICDKCLEKSCLRGNERGWGCPYELLVPKIDRNMDCGLCTECFKSCRFDNISLTLRKSCLKPPVLRNSGEVYSILIMMTLAIAYSFTLHSPWYKIRDIVNMVDKPDWGSFSLYLALLWSSALFIVPAIFKSLCLAGKKLSKSVEEKRGLYKKVAPTFIPIGISLWSVFFVGMFLPNFTYIQLALSDPFGWGWDIFGLSGKPWIQLIPWAIPWIQVTILIIGLYFSLKTGLRIWEDISRNRIKAVIGFIPVSILLLIITLIMAAYFSNF